MDKYINRRRLFNSKERIALFIGAGGLCMYCGTSLVFTGMHADHEIPYSKGGITEIRNGRASCPNCNRIKGDSIDFPYLIKDKLLLSTSIPKPSNLTPPRKWIQKAFVKYTQNNNTDFLCVACPSAGKTRFALMVARQLLNEKKIVKVIIVVPTNYLKSQWAKEAKKIGINIDPDYVTAKYFNKKTEDYDGIATTFAQVAKSPLLFEYFTKDPTLVILDEVHHLAEEKSWGESLSQAFNKATKRLLLSGTPFRNDNIPIAFVKYDQNNTCIADFEYTLNDGWKDGVIRKVSFEKIGGKVRWKENKELQTEDLYSISSTKKRKKAINIALSSQLDYLSGILLDATETLNNLRKNDHPQAGGLIIANDIAHAKEIEKILKEKLNEQPLIISSEEIDCTKKIDRFKKNSEKWIITIKMISEGVDIPRLRVLVYATSVRTDLFFQQAIGRVLRKSEDPVASNRIAYIFLPNEKCTEQLISKLGDNYKHQLQELQEVNGKNSTTLQTSDDRSTKLIPIFAKITEKEPLLFGSQKRTPLTKKRVRKS